MKNASTMFDWKFFKNLSPNEESCQLDSAIFVFFNLKTAK